MDPKLLDPKTLDPKLPSPREDEAAGVVPKTPKLDPDDLVVPMSLKLSRKLLDPPIELPVLESDKKDGNGIDAEVVVVTVV